jgi:hypothetical protein
MYLEWTSFSIGEDACQVKYIFNFYLKAKNTKSVQHVGIMIHDLSTMTLDL